ncbi:MAG: A/G-specific adenine glycosylase [Chthoniobacteraceae bacterium]
MNITNLPDPKPFRARLTAWFRRHGRDLPWRRDTSPYAVLVSEFMLQQTQVATVVPYFERWMRRFPDFAALAAAGEADVLSLWQGLGYYSRARNLHRAAKLVVEQHGGSLPDDIATLPGAGRYTAGAIAAFAFDRSVATVDGNIARVLSRVLDLRVQADDPSLWLAADALRPTRGGRLHTSALMELGALICTARSPQCPRCPVRNFCKATEPEKLPIKKSRARTVALDEPCAWIHRRGAILLEQQTGPRWRGLWKLPPIAPPARAPLHTSEYPFTNHRVTLRVFPSAPPKPLAPHQSWIRVAALDTLPLTAPHRRAIETLLQ